MTSTYPFTARCSSRASLVERHRRVLRWWREQEAAEGRIVATLSRRLDETVAELRALGAITEPGDAVSSATDSAGESADDARAEELGSRLLHGHQRLEESRSLLAVASREVAKASMAMHEAERSLQQAVQERDAWYRQQASGEADRELERSFVLARARRDGAAPRPTVQGPRPVVPLTSATH